MTNHTLSALLDILSLEPAHDPTRIELERIVVRARLNEADTEVPAPPLPDTRRDHRRCQRIDVIFE